LDGDGNLFFVDRIKDAIRRKGENISAWEVESVLLSHPDVVECAVYAFRPEGADDDEVMAALVLKGAATAAGVVADVEHRLPRYAVPRFVRVLAELPRTSTEKVEKNTLRASGLDEDVVDLRNDERSRSGPANQPLEKSGE
jgi:crotonobetaine/carnitine-CoA ligase